MKILPPNLASVAVKLGATKNEISDTVHSKILSVSICGLRSAAASIQGMSPPKNSKAKRTNDSRESTIAAYFLAVSQNLFKLLVGAAGGSGTRS